MANYPSRHPSEHLRELAQLDLMVVTVRWKAFQPWLALPSHVYWNGES